MNSTEAYLPVDYPRICLLDTDITEPEVLIRNIAASASQQCPERFQGEVPHVFFRLRYTPPYETFHELKNLILRIRKAAGLRSEYRGLICIDPSEYKDHENEEYFIAFLKYLYDNAGNSTVLLVCCQYSEQSLEKLYGVCMKYFSVDRKQIHIYKEESLVRRMKSVYKKHDICIDKKSLALLASILSRPELIPYRSLQLIERIPYEIKSGKSLITFSDVEAYFQNAHSSICMLAGHPLIEEKGENLEYTF